MKIILLKDVKGVGRKNDIKDVPQGYADNLLLPKKLAIIATPKSLAEHKARVLREEEEKKVSEELIRQILSTVREKDITMSVKANEKGHLFAKLHIPEIVEAIKRGTGADVDPSWIVGGDKIREIGDHKIYLEAVGEKVELILKVSAI